MGAESTRLVEWVEWAAEWDDDVADPNSPPALLARRTAVRRCAPDPPPKKNLHLHHPETSQDFITTNQKRLDEFMNLFFFLLLPLVGPLPLHFSKGIDDPSSHER